MMGYTTDFTGSFEIRPPLTPEHKAYLDAFAGTRRMRRNAEIAAKFHDPVRLAVELPIGIDGEFFVGSTANHGQNKDESIVEYNRPPSDQPTLWCQWRPNADGTRLEWDEGEKFYSYTEWLRYLRDTFLTPWGYELGGQVRWQGDDPDDRGIIYVQGAYFESIADDISNGPPEWYGGDDAEEEQEDL